MEVPDTIPLTDLEKMTLENLALKFQLLTTQLRLIELERDATFASICNAHGAPEGTRVDLAQGVLILENKK